MKRLHKWDIENLVIDVKSSIECSSDYLNFICKGCTDQDLYIIMANLYYYSFFAALYTTSVEYTYNDAHGLYCAYDNNIFDGPIMEVYYTKFRDYEFTGRVTIKYSWDSKSTITFAFQLKLE